MKRSAISFLWVTLLLAGSLSAEVTIDGFMQALFGGRLDQSNPTKTEQTAAETRLQLRAEHFGDEAEFFGRLDFVWDGSDSSRYVWELREGWVKFSLGSQLDFKIGRQIMTWGTGDLIFINDLFAKDYRSFFVGRDDQYLKAPQTALRTTYYNSVADLDFVWSPRFEPNRLPQGVNLSYYMPGQGIVGTGLDPDFYFDVAPPEAKFENGEFALRASRQFGYFSLAGYFYKGFYKNPMGANPDMSPLYPRLNVYGLSLRGQTLGGILWLEGGYYDSRDDRDGDNPLMPNSSMVGLIGFERQVATNLTANLQWQADFMNDHELYEAGLPTGAFVRDEVKHLLTSRVTKLLAEETVTLSAFGFYSPTDEDSYVRLSVGYKYSDELDLTLGGNLFDGQEEATEFGQFQKNDNAYLKVTYGF